MTKKDRARANRELRRAIVRIWLGNPTLHAAAKQFAHEAGLLRSNWTSTAFRGWGVAEFEVFLLARAVELHDEGTVLPVRV